MATQTSTLEAKQREASGKGAARKLRAQKLIPGVVYSRHMKAPLHIAVDPLAVRKAINTPRRFNTLISLKIEGGTDQLVLVKDFQADPVTRVLLHADFLGVKEDEQVKVNVPVELVGKAEGVVAGGILEQKRRDIEVWALPGSIPERIEVDVTHLKVTQALHSDEIKLPAGLTLKTTVNYTIAVVTAPDAEIVAAPVAAAVPVAGAAAAAPASGAAPAAAAAKGGKEGGAKK